MVKLSIWADSRDEIARHKWIESQRFGYDRGESAVREWIRDHWSGYLRAKWIEHLHGRTFWIELESRDFGLLQTAFHHNTLLLDCILDRLKAGQENLDIIQWAIDWHIPMCDVHEILSTFDINGKRIGYRFDG